MDESGYNALVNSNLCGYISKCMILHRVLTRKEVLEAIIMLAAKSIPDDIDGDISADFDEDGGVEVFFVRTPNEEELN